MTKKLEGLFGLKLGEYFDESKYSIIEKTFDHDSYHIKILTPPTPNILFINYAVMCTKEMIVESQLLY